MKILRPAPDVFLKVSKVSNSFIELEEGISPMSMLESGAFTPVISDRVDCNVTPLRGIYSRVNNVVTMTLYLSIALDSAGGVGQFNVALPVASTFETARDCYGTANLMTNSINNMTYYIISADTASNKCAVEVEGNTGISDVSVFVATIQYLVI
jgi:hypothetical protein